MDRLLSKHDHRRKIKQPDKIRFYLRSKSSRFRPKVKIWNLFLLFMSIMAMGNQKKRQRGQQVASSRQKQGSGSSNQASNPSKEDFVLKCTEEYLSICHPYACFLNSEEAKYVTEQFDSEIYKMIEIYKFFHGNAKSIFLWIEKLNTDKTGDAKEDMDKGLISFTTAIYLIFGLGIEKRHLENDTEFSKFVKSLIDEVVGIYSRYKDDIKKLKNEIDGYLETKQGINDTYKSFTTKDKSMVNVSLETILYYSYNAFLTIKQYLQDADTIVNVDWMLNFWQNQEKILNISILFPVYCCIYDNIKSNQEKKKVLTDEKMKLEQEKEEVATNSTSGSPQEKEEIDTDTKFKLRIFFELDNYDLTSGDNTPKTSEDTATEASENKNTKQVKKFILRLSRCSKIYYEFLTIIGFFDEDLEINLKNYDLYSVLKNVFRFLRSINNLMNLFTSIAIQNDREVRICDLKVFYQFLIDLDNMYTKLDPKHKDHIFSNDALSVDISSSFVFVLPESDKNAQNAFLESNALFSFQNTRQFEYNKFNISKEAVLNKLQAIDNYAKYAHKNVLKILTKSKNIFFQMFKCINKFNHSQYVSNESEFDEIITLYSKIRSFIKEEEDIYKAIDTKNSNDVENEIQQLITNRESTINVRKEIKNHLDTIKNNLNAIEQDFKENKLIHPLIELMLFYQQYLENLHNFFYFEDKLYINQFEYIKNCYFKHILLKSVDETFINKFLTNKSEIINQSIKIYENIKNIYNEIANQMERKIKHTSDSFACIVVEFKNINCLAYDVIKSLNQTLLDLLSNMTIDIYFYWNYIRDTEILRNFLFLETIKRKICAENAKKIYLQFFKEDIEADFDVIMNTNQFVFNSEEINLLLFALNFINLKEENIDLNIISFMKEWSSRLKEITSELSGSIIYFKCVDDQILQIDFDNPHHTVKILFISMEDKDRNFNFPRNDFRRKSLYNFLAEYKEKMAKCNKEAPIFRYKDFQVVINYEKLESKCVLCSLLNDFIKNQLISEIMLKDAGYNYKLLLKPENSVKEISCFFSKVHSIISFNIEYQIQSNRGNKSVSIFNLAENHSENVQTNNSNQSAGILNLADNNEKSVQTNHYDKFIELFKNKCKGFSKEKVNKIQQLVKNFKSITRAASLDSFIKFKQNQIKQKIKQEERKNEEMLRRQTEKAIEKLRLEAQIDREKQKKKDADKEEEELKDIIEKSENYKDCLESISVYFEVVKDLEFIVNVIKMIDKENKGFIKQLHDDLKIKDKKDTHGDAIPQLNKDLKNNDKKDRHKILNNASLQIIFFDFLYLQISEILDTKEMAIKIEDFLRLKKPDMPDITKMVKIVKNLMDYDFKFEKIEELKNFENLDSDKFLKAFNRAKKLWEAEKNRENLGSTKQDNGLPRKATHGSENPEGSKRKNTRKK